MNGLAKCSHIYGGQCLFWVTVRKRVNSENHIGERTMISDDESFRQDAVLVCIKCHLNRLGKKKISFEHLSLLDPSVGLLVRDYLED